MAQVKAHEVDRYLANPSQDHSIFLIYGPDTGLVSERASLLARKSGVALDDPFATIRLDADEAAADPARIATEAHTISMFGGRRLIRLSGSTQKNLASAVQPVLDMPPDDCWIVIEAGDLKKSAPLRTRIEKTRHAIALPCYQDAAKALDSMIEQEMRAAGLTISADARGALLALLGGDRLASRGEVQKLCLYAAGKSEISLEDVRAIVGDASGLDLDALIDAAIAGDIATMERVLKRLLADGTNPVTIVMAMQRQFQMLHKTRAKMEETRSGAQAAISGMRPPVMYQRRELVLNALSRWSVADLQKAMERIARLSFEVRANAALAQALLGTAFLAIAIQAKRANKR